MTVIAEKDIINTLDDLRQLKTERQRIKDEIEGLESDIQSGERALQEQIKAFTSGGEARPGW